MNKVYIVVKHFNSELAKRQPWYSVQYIISELKANGFRPVVVSHLAEIPESFDGKVLKILSLIDFLKLLPSNHQWKLYFLVSMPIYRLEELAELSMRHLFLNFGDLWRILIVSLLPKFWVRHILSRAHKAVFFSDKRFNLFDRLENRLLLFPFIKGNWGEPVNNILTIKRTANVVAYLGPPFETRGFEEVCSFFSQNTELPSKLIVRTERAALIKRLARSNITNIHSKIVSGMLDRSQICKELLDVKILLLPFKLVMSELPIVVLEALELGILPLTTCEAGVTTLPGFPSIILSKTDKIDLRVVSELLEADFCGDSLTKFWQSFDNTNDQFWGDFNAQD